MELYIEFGLTSDFNQFREEITRRLKQDRDTHRAISELNMTPKAIALAQMASVAAGFLQSGEHHTGKGQLNAHGQELLKVHHYALNMMLEGGFTNKTDVQSKMDYIEKKVRELGA
jgi:hypothetical protein